MFNILKIILISLSLSFFSGASYADAKTKKKVMSSRKIYSQKEADELVQTEIKKQLEKIVGKNLVSLSKEIIDKERSIQGREDGLNKRASELKKIEEDLAKKFGELHAEQKKILGCISEIESNKKKRLGHMVAAIEGMRPKSAANVLSVQDPDIAVTILDRLAPVKVSKIFNSMKEEKAAGLQKLYLNMKR